MQDGIIPGVWSISLKSTQEKDCGYVSCAGFSNRLIKSFEKELQFYGLQGDSKMKLISYKNILNTIPMRLLVHSLGKIICLLANIDIVAIKLSQTVFNILNLPVVIGGVSISGLCLLILNRASTQATFYIWRTQ